MKFLEKPAALLAALVVSIFSFGAGLTSPIWLIVSGRKPLEAIRTGTPIVGVTIVGLIITVLLAVALFKVRPLDDIDQPYVREAASDGKHRTVHLLVVLMFVVPFLTIVLGYLLHSVIDFDAG